jgi:hypothetical protein
MKKAGQAAGYSHPAPGLPAEGKQKRDRPAGQSFIADSISDLSRSVSANHTTGLESGIARFAPRFGGIFFEKNRSIRIYVIPFVTTQAGKKVHRNTEKIRKHRII